MKRSLSALAACVLVSAALQAPASEPQLGAFTRIVVPTSANASGQNGAFFRTKLAILNVTQLAYPIQVILYSTGGQVQIANINMSPGGVVNFDNILQELFAFNGAGAMVFESSAGTGREFMISAQVYNDKAGCGRLYTVVTGGPILEPSLPELDNFSTGIFIDANNRTNVGIFNDSSASNTITYDVFNAAGAVVFSDTKTVGSKTWNQFGITGITVAGGYIKWRVTGQAYLWAVVNDNASSDGTFLPAAEQFK